MDALWGWRWLEADSRRNFLTYSAHLSYITSSSSSSFLRIISSSLSHQAHKSSYVIMSRDFLLMLLAALACVVASAVDPSPTCTSPGWCGGGQTAEDKQTCEGESNFVDLTDGSSALPKDTEPLADGTTTTSITYTSLKKSVYSGRVVTNAGDNAKRAFGDVKVTCTSTCSGGGTINGCDADWSGCSPCSCFGSTTGSCTCTKTSVYTESKNLVAGAIGEDDGSVTRLRTKDP